MNASTRRDLLRLLALGAAGQYPIAVGAALAGIRGFQSKGVGKRVEQTPEPEYSYLGTRGVVALTNAPHPNAIRVFLAWLLRQEGRDQWAQNSTPDATTRRLDVTVYHPDTTPDWNRLAEYELLGGTPEFAAIQDRIIAIASGKASRVRSSLDPRISDAALHVSRRRRSAAGRLSDCPAADKQPARRCLRPRDRVGLDNWRQAVTERAMVGAIWNTISLAVTRQAISLM